MSLNVALSAAVSSLLVIEKQMGVAANNIANANTTGYSVESVQIGTSVSNGVGVGVMDLGTTSEVNQFLLKSVLAATTDSAQATAYNTLYQSLQTALGTITTNTTGGNDLASELSSLESSLTTLAATPSDTALTSKVVQNLDNLVSTLRSTATQIQSLRTTADKDITDAVSDANTQLNTINDLNKQIAKAEGLGQSTAALEDQRNNALTQLSADLGVNAYVDGNNQMQVYTSSGQPLLTGNTVSTLSHVAVTCSSSTTYASGTINGIMVGNTDITSDVTSGKIAAYLQMRDTELPNAQNALDTLAQNITSTLNTIANQGSSNPPPSKLTSANGFSFAATDAVAPSADCKVRIAMVDSTGAVQSVQDVDLSGCATVNDVVDAINTAFGSTVASLNGSGQLVLTATSGQGVAVANVSGTLGGTNFSSYFHLNDIITSGTSSATISVNSTLLSNAYRFPTATLNTTAAADSVPFAGIGTSDGSTASALANALEGNLTFSPSTASGTTAESSATTALGLSGSFTIQGGSSPVTVTITSAMTLTQIAAAINAAAGATGVQAKVVGSGAYQLQITTGGGALSFTGISGNVLSSLGLSSAPTGYLGTTTTTLAGYATSLISDVAMRANNASTTDTTKSTTLTTLQNNLSSQSGVNTDEETAKLTQLQSAYAASAKIVSTVQTMFNALLQAVS